MSIAGYEAFVCVCFFVYKTLCAAFQMAVVGHQLYDFKERGVDLEVEGVRYIEMHRGPAAYVLDPPPSRGGDLELMHATSSTKVYSRSVDPRKLRVGVKYYVVHSCTHQNHILRLLVCTRTARLDIAVNGFWGGRFEKTYMDVRVFNPHAPSNRNTSIAQCYRKHEQEKRRSYDQRIREIEHASFTPQVLSATGGLAKQAEVFYKRLASLLASKWDQQYEKTLSWLRCKLCYCLLRSAIQCIRGARSSREHAVSSTPPIDLVIEESQVNH